jgi:hypothetical protein
MKFFSTVAAMLAMFHVSLAAGIEPALGTPDVEFLYQANITVDDAWPVGDVGVGSIRILPILSGTFEGPRIKGTISHLGADWLYTDTFGVPIPDTRYNLLTDDGVNIYIRTSGAGLKDGRYQLRGFFSTGDEKYRWLTYIISYGIVSFDPASGSVQIEMWTVTPPELDGPPSNRTLF